MKYPRPVIQSVQGSDNQYQLHENYYCEISFGGYLYKISITKGMYTDGASIPQFLWSIFGNPFEGSVIAGGLVHDGGYQEGCSLTKWEWDNILYYIIRAEGMNYIKAQCIYAGVRVGGSKFWNDYRKKDKTRKENHVTVIKEKLK